MSWILTCQHCSAWMRIVPRSTPSTRRAQIIAEHVGESHPEETDEPGTA